MKIVLITFLIAVSFFSCYDLEDIPQHTASFTAKLNGEGNVIFNVTETDVETFHWDFGDGNFSDEKSPAHTYENNDIYNVTLSIKGKGGESILTGQVKVNDITGSIIFWLSASKALKIELTVDGQYYGNITGVYPTSVPACGANDAVTVTNLSEGSHTFEGKELNTVSPRRWIGVVSIKGRKCNAMGLTY